MTVFLSEPRERNGVSEHRDQSVTVIRALADIANGTLGEGDELDAGPLADDEDVEQDA